MPAISFCFGLASQSASRCSLPCPPHLPLWVPPQCMPGDIAGRLSESVPDPTPLAPSSSYMVPTFHVPNNVVALGVRRGVGIAASFRLSLRRVMGVPEETSSPPKTDVTLCVFPMVSVISFYPLGGWLALWASAEPHWPGIFRVMSRPTWLL